MWLSYTSRAKKWKLLRKLTLDLQKRSTIISPCSFRRQAANRSADMRWNSGSWSHFCMRRNVSRPLFNFDHGFGLRNRSERVPFKSSDLNKMNRSFKTHLTATEDSLGEDGLRNWVTFQFGRDLLSNFFCIDFFGTIARPVRFDELVVVLVGAASLAEPVHSILAWCRRYFGHLGGGVGLDGWLDLDLHDARVSAATTATLDVVQRGAGQGQRCWRGRDYVWLLLLLLLLLVILRVDFLSLKRVTN